MFFSAVVLRCYGWPPSSACLVSFDVTKGLAFDMAVPRVVPARYACPLPATTHTQAGRIRTAIISHAVPPVRYRAGGERTSRDRQRFAISMRNYTGTVTRVCASFIGCGRLVTPCHHEPGRFSCPHTLWVSENERHRKPSFGVCLLSATRPDKAHRTGRRASPPPSPTQRAGLSQPKLGLLNQKSSSEKSSDKPF